MKDSGDKWIKKSLPGDDNELFRTLRICITFYQEGDIGSCVLREYTSFEQERRSNFHIWGILQPTVMSHTFHLDFQANH